MVRVRKEFCGKLNVSVDNRYIQLDENTAQEDLLFLSKDENVSAFLETFDDVLESGKVEKPKKVKDNERN